MGINVMSAGRPDAIALDYMRKSPPTDLMGLARDLGLRINYADLDSVAGMIEMVRSERGPEFMITINKTDNGNRQRFTLAHEIAHFIKHRKQLEGGDIIDNAMYRSLLPEPMEWEANRYAAQLLMPLSAMKKLWNEGLRDPAVIATRLGVSEQAAKIRIDQLRGSLAVMEAFGQAQAASRLRA
jgi:Zn-dependent peptidase ImmA (M78 family)